MKPSGKQMDKGNVENDRRYQLVHRRRLCLQIAAVNFIYRAENLSYVLVILVRVELYK